jgi:dTDP-4-amino-4,6-dideoxygalactose transaminase
MHTFGHPVDMDGLMDLASEFKLVVVEDAAESLGSTYKGKHTGTLGILGVLSFNGNKTITTGGGGAILTNDPELARRAKHLTTTAKLTHAWEYRHDEVGYNYRMPNINAAIGCAQLEQLPQLLESKRDLFSRYQGAFNKVDGVQLMSEPSGCLSNYWLQTIVLTADNAKYRDVVLDATNNAGLMTRPTWVLMKELTQFSAMPSMNLDVARELSQRIINIPSNCVEFAK